MATSASTNAKIARFIANTEKADRIVNGGITTLVETDGGLVPSFAKQMHDLGEQNVSVSQEFLDALEASVNASANTRLTAMDTRINGEADDVLSELDTRVNLAADGILVGARAARDTAIEILPKFVSVAPSSPIAGQMWTDSETGRKYEWVIDADSSQWVETGAVVSVGVTTEVGATGAAAQAAASAATAGNSAISAALSASTAFAQADIATVKASEAATSASEAATAAAVPALALRNDLSDTTDPLKNSALVKHNATLNYVAGTIGWALNRVIDPTMFPWLVKNSGSYDAAENSAALEAAHAFAQSRNAQLKFSAGDYRFTDLSLTGSVNWMGDGDDSTFLIFTGGSMGAEITLNDVNDTVNMSEMTLRTTGTIGVGLDINYTVQGFAGRDEQRVRTNNLHFEGLDRLANGWTIPFRMTNINGSYHENLWLNGRSTGTASNAEADNTVSPTGVKITGNEFPTDHRFVSPTFYSVLNCFDVDGAVEGLTIESPVAVNVGRLVTWTPSGGFGGRPGYKLLNPHVNSYKGVSQLTAIQQVEIRGEEVYHNPGSTSNWVANELTDVIDAVIDGPGYFRYVDNASSATSEAIWVKGTSTRNINIGDGTFGGAYTRLDAGVRIDGTVPTGAIRIATSNKFNGNYRIADVVLGGNYQVLGERSLNVYRSAGFSLPSGIELFIDWDTTDCDPMELWASGRNTFTVPSGRNIRFIDVTASIQWDANSVGQRQLFIRRNGIVAAGDTRNATMGIFVTCQSVSRMLAVNGGDTISVSAFQSSGTPLEISGGNVSSLRIKVLT
jgi:hypothetical protein